ncbi:transposase family protein [Glutamicibacter mysorens]|uniref:transposase family protein n=1 Tax=Glutamicibacter mysorens TaxID=257984 RepID=UPI0020C60681|nr:transposase family protein [Glutamicibacter mysorens]UTM45744.1 transposase family protein [Glutamicibacter mysorens]
MRYNSTTGMPEEQVIELTARVNEVLNGRRTPAKGPGGRPVVLGLYRQVVLVLVLLRQNMIQSVAADLFGISQPTVSRIYRTLLPIFDQVLAFHEPGTLTDLALEHTLLIDGTDVPTRRFRAGITENYSGKKESNRQVSLIRSAAERAIAHLKNWKILATSYRARLKELPMVIRIVSRLEYYRLGW